MSTFNYLQDFSIWQQILYRDENGKFQDFGFPPYDFKCIYWTTSKNNKYVASCQWIDGIPHYVNCRNDDNRLIVIFDHCGLLPGELKGEMILDFPDDNYPDGFQNSTIPLKTDIRLSYKHTEMPSLSEAIAIMPHIKGRDGKDFSYQDLSEEEKNELAKKISQNIEIEIPEISLEDIPDEIFDNLF